MGWTYITEQSQLLDIIPKIAARGSWGSDTETTGLDPYIDKVILLQIGNFEEQFLIDTRKVNPEPLRELLENPSGFYVMHNAKFDYKMMKTNFGIEMEKMRDTYLAAKLVDLGRKERGFKLDNCLEDRLGVIVDKKLQKSFINHVGDFSEAQLNYAAEDVKHLLNLNRSYSKTMALDSADAIANRENVELGYYKKDLRDTYVLECAAIPSFGDMELHGLILDKGPWKQIIEENLHAANEIARQLDEIAAPFRPVDLFGNVDINYGSPKQVVKLLNELGVKTTVIDRRTGEKIELDLENSSNDVLKQIKDVPAVKLLSKWRKHMKVVSTYGQPFLDAIHPVTDRIHPLFNQIGTTTGRPASASDSPVNMLNIPRSPRMRNCFIAGEDYVIETDDYSGCELRILAHLSQDKNFMEPLVKGEDLHCSVATRLYGKLVTKSNENKELRTPAKNLNFGIIYGMQSKKLCIDINAQGFPITPEETQKLYDSYCETYSDGVNFLRNCGRQAAKLGFSVNSNGRRRYWLLPNPGDRLKFPRGVRDFKYQRMISDIEREAGNHPIQSTNADITKYAMIRLRKHIKQKKVRSGIMLQVYDEIVTRTHKEDSEEFHAAKVKIMEEAAARWVTTVPIEIEGHVLPYWTK
jgi:DNA polymerase I-like protein with 3'-5' exonuclease and polymerase domains